MAEYQDKYTLDIKQVLDALNQVDKTNEKVYKRAEQAANRAIKGIIADHKRLIAITKQLDKSIADEAKQYQKLAKEAERAGKAGKETGENLGRSAQLSGVQIGFVSGLIQQLTQNFIQLGQAAVRALIETTKESVALASELETTGAIFEGIFGKGNEEAALAALNRIRAESRGLGIDLAETSRAFLPFVSSLEELSRVNRISAALAIAQPEQGQLGARIALQEALSGNIQSLVRRFEIPKTFAKELQKALDEGGTEAFVTEFESILKRMGRDLDQLTDTIQFSFGKARENLTQLQAAFGVPITEELKEELNGLNKIFDENFGELEGLATLAGNAIAEIVDAADASAIAQFFIDNKQEIAEFLTAIREIVKSAKELADVDLTKGINVDSLTNAALKINQIVDALNAIQTISQSLEAQGPAGAGFIGALQGGLEGLFPLFSTFIQIWENLDRVILAVIATYGLFTAVAAQGQAVLNNAYQEFLVFTGQMEESQKKLVDPQQAYSEAIAKTNEAIAEYKQNTAEAAKAVAETVIPVKASTEANEGLTDALLAQRKAMDDLAQLEDDYAAAQAKVAEKMAEAAKDHARRLEDIDIETARKQLDIQIEFAQKREDAARNNLEKLADIRRKHGQDIADAATDLERKEEDIARKFADERIDLERDQRQKRVDIETSFREKLQTIQREDAFDLEEAERKRDAVGFLRILRQQQQKVSQAQIDRQKEIDELKITGDRRKEELAIQQQRELREARIANEQKIEDLRLNLNRQIEAQNIAYEQQLNDIAINEQRKNEELARSRERDIEDANKAYARKLEDLRAALEAELKLIEEFAARKAELEAQIAATPAPGRSNRASSPRSSTGALPAPRSAPAGPTSRQGQINQARQQQRRSVGGRRQFGGLVNAGGAHPVGENGPELFIPPSNGRIVPNSALVMPTMQPRAAINNISNVRGGPQISVPDAAGLLGNPIAVRQIENIILRMLGEAG